jgi:hypothetical protein
MANTKNIEEKIRTGQYTTLPRTLFAITRSKLRPKKKAELTALAQEWWATKSSYKSGAVTVTVPKAQEKTNGATLHESRVDRAVELYREMQESAREHKRKVTNALWHMSPRDLAEYAKRIAEVPTHLDESV